MSTLILNAILEQLKSLPEDMQKQVLHYVRALNTATRQGVPGRLLLEFAGAIPGEDLNTIQQAIESGCEQVDLNEW